MINLKKQFFFSLFSISVLLGLTQSVNAGSISASPSSATKYVNENFTVVVRVSNSVSFKGFQANVSLNGLTLVSFTNNLPGGLICANTPSAGNLSFACAYTGGGSATSLNVYTITVKGTGVGTKNINISGALIREVGSESSVSASAISGNYNIVVRPTSPPAAPTSTPEPTLPITPEATATPTPIPTPTPEPPTVIQILNPNNAPLINSEVTIDGVDYMTDNSGYVSIPSLTQGNHDVKFTFDDKTYEYSFILGAYTDNNEPIIQFVYLRQDNNSIILSYALIIGGILAIINVSMLYLIYRRRERQSN